MIENIHMFVLFDRLLMSKAFFGNNTDYKSYILFQPSQ